MARCVGLRCELRLPHPGCTKPQHQKYLDILLWGVKTSMAARPFRPPSKHSKVVSHHSWNKWNNSAQAGNVKSHRRRVLPLRFRPPIRPQPPQQQSTQWEGYLGSYQFRSRGPLRAVSYGRVRKAR